MRRDGGLARANDLLSVSAAARMAGISRSYIYRVMDAGKLDWYEMGGRRMIHKRDLYAFIDSRRRKAS